MSLNEVMDVSEIELDFPGVQTARDESELKDAIVQHLWEAHGQLPVDGACENGGMPNVTDIKEPSPYIEGDKLTASVTVEFDEVMPTECNKINHEAGQSCSLEVEISMSSGHGTVRFGENHYSSRCFDL